MLDGRQLVFNFVCGSDFGMKVIDLMLQTSYLVHFNILKMDFLIFPSSLGNINTALLDAKLHLLPSFLHLH